jgi:Family of unknown function (DUF5678)
MRDNSGIDDLTKINTETEFQPEDTFKRRSKCAKIFGRVGNIFMVLITSNSYKSYIQYRLHDLGNNVSDSLTLIRKSVFSVSGFETWDEWAIYFEQKDFKTLDLRERGIFFLVCARMQRDLLREVSDPSFSWNTINLEGEAFYLNLALELEQYLYDNHKRSLFKKFLDGVDILILCNQLWINFFDVISYYDEMCYEYVKIILELNYKYTKESIVESTEDVVHTFDSKGEPFSYEIKDLYPSEDSYNYMKRQSKIFEENLPKLVSKYAGEYVLFEDGNVIDHDKNENKLLDRIWETDFVNERMGANGSGIYCHLVPNQIPVNV